MSEWISFFSKAIDNNLYLIKIAKKTSPFLSTQLGTPEGHHTRAFKKEIIHLFKDDFEHAKQHCDLFGTDQLDNYQELINELLEVERTIVKYSCSH